MKINYKNNYIQKIGLIALCSGLLVLPACKKSFLDVDPQAQQPAVTFWKTQDDATKAVNSIYANLRSWENTAFPALAVESIAGDDAEKGSSANDASYLNGFDAFTVTSTEGQLQGFWTGQYQNINLCNQVLDNIPAISMDPNLKSRYLAEAKFVRAYSYFRLVRAFGDVPLRLNVPKDASEFNIPRTPKAQVYAAIEKDLNDAATILPQTYASVDKGRATKGAALALHAKVAMYQQKWADVLSLTNTVMTMGYGLVPNYEQSFRLNNENSVESVFEIQCEIIQSIAGSATSQYSQVQGVRGSVAGWGFNVPTAALAAAYETGDVRRDATIIFRGETTPEGDAIDPSGDNPMYNQKSYVPFSLIITGFNEGAQQNVRVLRYADVLLMNAEAANEQGNPTLAKTSLNLVRARARGGGLSVLPDVTTSDKDALRTAIWKERQVELAMESDRYFDVIRQGRGTAVFGAKGWKANKNEVWPIPSTEIDKSAGTLTQNLGY
ncbi:RagB/SusD family nutrient uptake outer membrane protein [Pedobacter fastidiosus]|uniref:RagB/SusD family nutrient uptake outer membrane protein n=1 Tax=Pedobacter fastidiosus TaxID=2765361 RepID=A0ABR7KNH4_9SPHI|nr:RagB/SusD family nutrient uptake outer membrane protein [Pedobacter fastidiosus]MBC6109620.1 RagB/SusD family nutrient uptake outer membrane protein [Pedobacter fastidiosus]